MNLRLKEIRGIRGLSQEDMANRLGIKKSRYGTWERGERMLSAEQLCDCADVLDCSADAILGRDVPRSFADPRQAELNRMYESSDEEARVDILRAARNAHAASVGRAGGGEEAGSPPSGAMSA